MIGGPSRPQRGIMRVIVIAGGDQHNRAIRRLLLSVSSRPKTYPNPVRQIRVLPESRGTTTRAVPHRGPRTGQALVLIRLTFVLDDLQLSRTGSYLSRQVAADAHDHAG
jgi:hypothetical protein